MEWENALVRDALKDVKTTLQALWVQTYKEKAWIETEILKALSWCEANPRKAPKLFGRFMTAWLSRAYESYRKTIPSSPHVVLRKATPVVPPVQPVDGLFCATCGNDGYVYATHKSSGAVKAFRCDCYFGQHATATHLEVYSSAPEFELV